MGVDAVSMFLLKTTEASAQRLLFVGSVDVMHKRSTEDASTLVGVVLEQRPGGAMIDTLV